jgi:methylenetetrahydrofolate dehydrogenase (NADP+)/methenyltetrahydrofolate cyclohydrolase
MAKTEMSKTAKKTKVARIIDGRKLRDLLIPKLVKKIAQLDVKPKLVIIQVGNHKESNSYIAMKMAFAQRVGALVEHKKYPKNASENEVVSDILSYNADPAVHGVMVQLPTPAGFSTSRIVESIDPKKDVDGLTAANTKFIFDNDGKSKFFLPATTKGIISLLEHYKVAIPGKRVVLVGESVLVGRPTALAFLNRKATVTICHLHTKKLNEETKRADILVVAAGEPNLISAKHVSKGVVVVDVGTNINKQGKTVGDVNFEKVKNIAGAITPVPGGVGPMTVLSLFENLVDSAQIRVR